MKNPPLILSRPEPRPGPGPGLSQRIPRRPCFPVRAAGTRTVTFLCGLGLVIGCLLPGGPALAQERPVFKPVLQRQLESQVLPEVRFHDADFTDALLYLQMKALASSQNAVRVPFIVQLPADFKPRYELTLDLKSVPFWEALRHLGGQAGVEFSIEGDSVRVRPLSVAAAAKVAGRTVMPAPVPPPAAPAPAPEKKVAGRLGDPAKPFAAGNNAHYSSVGVIQPQRSGTISHRNLTGWALPSDRGNRLSMNCIDIKKCIAHGGGCCAKGSAGCECGCYACACQPPKSDPKPAPAAQP